MNNTLKGFFTGLHRRWRLYVVLSVCVDGLTLAKPGALLAIEGYQKFVSPYKGYRCANGVLYGTSCSEFAKQAIREHDLAGGLILLPHQFRDCNKAAVRIRSGAFQVSGARAAYSKGCTESERDRGRRESKETQEYCVGCVEGFFE